MFYKHLFCSLFLQNFPNCWQGSKLRVVTEGGGAPNPDFLFPSQALNTSALGTPSWPHRNGTFPLLGLFPHPQEPFHNILSMSCWLISVFRFWTTLQKKKNKEACFASLMSTRFPRNPQLLPWRPWALLALPGSLVGDGRSPSHLHHPGSAGSYGVSQTLTFLFSLKAAFIVQSPNHVWLCHPMDCSPQGSLVLQYLPGLAQTHVHWVRDAIQPSHPLLPPSPGPQSFPASGSFAMSRLFTSGGQSMGASASASVLPMNIQDWLPLGWTGVISLQSKGLSRVFSQYHTWKASILQHSAFFMVELSHPYMTIGKNTALRSSFIEVSFACYNMYPFQI